MILNRNITSIVNWCLDNICPPILREFKPFMSIVIWFAYGKYTKRVMQFKDQFAFMSEEEIASYYNMIKEAPINNRLTDLNRQSLTYILENIYGNTVLDVACGRGFLAQTISSKTGIQVTGIDIVKPLNKVTNVRYVQGDITNLPFEDNSFDTVLCTHALEHIRDYEKAKNELLRVAKKRIIIIVPCQREYHFTPDLHVNFFPYLYTFKKFIAVQKANYLKLGNDFVCLIDL